MIGTGHPCEAVRAVADGGSPARQGRLPALRQICPQQPDHDRFADSTTVYQSLARGLDPVFIERMHEFTLGRRWPDLTFLLDVAVDTGFARVHRRRSAGPADRIEAESREFHQAVRDGFLTLARRHPERFRVVSGEGAPAAIHRIILEAFDHALG